MIAARPSSRARRWPRAPHPQPAVAVGAELDLDRARPCATWCSRSSSRSSTAMTSSAELQRRARPRSSPRLCTATTVLPCQSQRWANSDGSRRLDRACTLPQPSSGVSLRRRISALHPVQQRVGVASLVGDVDVVAGRTRPPPAGARARPAAAVEKPPLRLGATTASARAPPSGPASSRLLAHADLVAVEDHRRPGQGEHQAPRQAQPVARRRPSIGATRRRRPWP